MKLPAGRKPTKSGVSQLAKLAEVWRKSGVSQLAEGGEIAFIKADNKYLDFYTEQGIFTECGTLKALEALWGNDWIRIHRNALVRKSAIQSFNSVGGETCCYVPRPTGSIGSKSSA